MLGIGFGLARAARHSGGGAVLPEAQALAARMSTAPTTERLRLVSALIGALKAGGVWPKLDALYILAAHDEPASRLNWAQDAYELTAVNSPTFTLDRGWQGDGATSRLASGFLPTGGGKMTATSAHLGMWSLTSVPVGAGGTSYDVGYHTGTANARLSIARPGSSPERAALFAVHSSVGMAINGTYARHVAWSRTASDLATAYADGAAGATMSEAGGALPGSPIDVLRAGTFYGINQIAVAHWGAGLSAAEMLILRDALHAYLIAVGAVTP
ncbi:hypothetical protein MKI84_13205 [Ancylobacter sp. A5.8]|uniref:hypothetical protein n=1 Tax=Ancylobacter gelatini TaxID=2919920 RepID=UPI001F4EF023|nr:hypothetical protein [Ancylobacter gelatini]MCJ8143876.1 hypothetical protein [Ancylobacter gelatini]